MAGKPMKMDWKNLGFQYRDTNGYVCVSFENGKWGPLEERRDPTFPIHVGANVLHYGQACFEGLKAFHTKTGEVVLFRPEKNAERMAGSAKRICMEAPPKELFVEACLKAIAMNREYVPPYGTGASLYIRPTLIGTQPTVGLTPSKEFLFFVIVTPVGPYYPNGFHPVEAVVLDEYDRAAPKGTGRAKVAGNYAAGLMPGLQAKEMGYPIVLFTDAVEHKYVDEFGTSNFIGITKNGDYKTPASTSILESITNDSLQSIARDFGLKVVKEPIALENLDQFSEVGACGTAAVITPISAITRGEKKWTFGEGKTVGPELTRLYRAFQQIQLGESEDKYGWLTAVSTASPAS